MTPSVSDVVRGLDMDIITGEDCQQPEIPLSVVDPFVRALPMVTGYYHVSGDTSREHSPAPAATPIGTPKYVPTSVDSPIVSSQFQTTATIGSGIDSPLIDGKDFNVSDGSIGETYTEHGGGGVPKTMQHLGDICKGLPSKEIQERLKSGTLFGSPVPPLTAEFSLSPLAATWKPTPLLSDCVDLTLGTPEKEDPGFPDCSSIWNNSDVPAKTER